MPFDAATVSGDRTKILREERTRRRALAFLSKSLLSPVQKKKKSCTLGRKKTDKKPPKGTTVSAGRTNSKGLSVCLGMGCALDGASAQRGVTPAVLGRHWPEASQWCGVCVFFVSFVRAGLGLPGSFRS